MRITNKIKMETILDMECIKLYMRNAFICVFKKNKKMIDSYLETVRGKHDKLCWFITNVRNNLVFKECVFNEFINTLFITHPTFVISQRNYEFISEYICKCISIDTDEYETDDVNEYVELIMDARGDNDTELLRLYYNNYLHYSMAKFISRMNRVIDSILRDINARRDAKRASIILLKIPNFNSDVISCITSYISKEYKHKK